MTLYRKATEDEIAAWFSNDRTDYPSGIRSDVVVPVDGPVYRPVFDDIDPARVIVDDLVEQGKLVEVGEDSTP